MKIYSNTMETRKSLISVTLNFYYVPLSENVYYRWEYFDKFYSRIMRARRILWICLTRRFQSMAHISRKLFFLD